MHCAAAERLLAKFDRVEVLENTEDF